MESESSPQTKCFVCKGPFHPATGGLHWVEFTQRFVPWCGACERDHVEWLIRHMKGRKRTIKVNGVKKHLYFYDYAHPPKKENE